jgi:hypothetical protein
VFWLTCILAGHEAATSRGLRKKRKRYLVNLHRAIVPLSTGERRFYGVFRWALHGWERFLSVFYVYGTTAGLGIRCRCGQGLRFLVMIKRCSIFAGVLGSLVVSEREGRGCIYVEPTRSICHVITWMGGRYMKDSWALVVWCRIIHLM